MVEIKCFSFVAWPLVNTFFKGLCEFMGGRSSLLVIILSCFVAIGLGQVKMKYLTCHAVFQNHVEYQLRDQVTL